MAAGLGFKTFTTGEVLTAADTNGYLMQGVLVFASSAARAAAITSPQEGQYSYLKDTNSTEYYDGAAWIAAPTGDITGVTAGTGISGGGTSGTVTITNSMATEIAAKGDLIAGTGSATFDNLTVGANNTVLTADSSTATGLKWAAASSGTFPILTIDTNASDFSTSSTSFVDITGTSITLTPVSATNKIEIKFSFVCPVSTGLQLDLKCLAGATALGNYTYEVEYNGGTPDTINAIWYATNVAASSTIFKVQAKVSTGTITFYGTSTGYANGFSTLEVY
jgi:hypothetical protein